MKKLLWSLLAACTLLTHAFAQNTHTAEGIIGTWLVQHGSAKIKIEKTNGKFSGKITWLKTPFDNTGKPVLDTKNPDKTLQSRPQLGLPLLENFVYDGDGEWTDGIIYDPDSGKTYSCNITLKDEETMEVRGYVGISLFGRTETWKRPEKLTMH